MNTSRLREARARRMAEPNIRPRGPAPVDLGPRLREVQLFYRGPPVFCIEFFDRGRDDNNATHLIKFSLIFYLPEYNDETRAQLYDWFNLILNDLHSTRNVFRAFDAWYIPQRIRMQEQHLREISRQVGRPLIVPLSEIYRTGEIDLHAMLERRRGIRTRNNTLADNIRALVGATGQELSPAA